jgi:hypothetical protein
MAAPDEAETETVQLGYRRFLDEDWSPGRLARWFNEIKLGGMPTWAGAQVRQLLRRRIYIGLVVNGMTRQVRDPDTGAVTVQRRPRKEWRVRRERRLQILPFRLWKAARRKLAKGRAAYAKDRAPDAPTRTELYPSVLVRPICGCCGAELMLGRSGKYASLCWLDGIRQGSRRHGGVFRRSMTQVEAPPGVQRSGATAHTGVVLDRQW